MSQHIVRCLLAWTSVSLFAAGAHAQLIVHEWGTMTTVHAPDGQPHTRINLIDDSEKLPNFVFHFEPRQSASQPYSPFLKTGRGTGRDDVTMRLETPVIYFYDPGNIAARRSFDLRVQMRGGILNDFYPIAQPKLEYMGADRTSAVNTITLNEQWSSSLAWQGITLDTAASIPSTNATVWTAPRQVTAAKLRVQKQGEHYLFYRGLANLPALLSTRHSRASVQLMASRAMHWTREDEVIARVWLVDVRADGSIAFATQDSLVLSKHSSKVLAQMKRFTTSDFAGSRRPALRGSMKSELIDAGLYADEADAMLNTWDASYFRKPGLRVFYTVPRAWTDFYLPLELSVAHEATRVLIGRIDLPTDQETT